MQNSYNSGQNDSTVFQVHVINHGDMHCDRALQTVKENCDLPGLAAWRSVNGNDGANSMFSTTHAAVNLIQAGLPDKVFIVTGRFNHPDLPEPVYHAWLEFRAADPIAVVNVSNLHERPLYAMKQADFYKVNFCNTRIQEVPLSRVKIKASQMANKNHAAGRSMSFDIGALALKVLQPTIRRMGEIQTQDKLSLST